MSLLTSSCRPVRRCFLLLWHCMTSSELNGTQQYLSSFQDNGSKSNRVFHLFYTSVLLQRSGKCSPGVCHHTGCRCCRVAGHTSRFTKGSPLNKKKQKIYKSHTGVALCSLNIAIKASLSAAARHNLREKGADEKAGRESGNRGAFKVVINTRTHTHTHPVLRSPYR